MSEDTTEDLAEETTDDLVEDATDEPAAEPVEALTDDEDDEGGLGIAPMLIGAAVFAAGAGVVGWLLLGSEENPFVYAQPLDQVVVEPDAYQGQELRVEGTLREGSIEFREEPCEWRFVLEKNEQEMAVSFPECVVPDTFRDGQGISVTVQGRYEEGMFVANQVVPKCPSRYEMEQMQKAGETMPHAPTEPAPS